MSGSTPITGQCLCGAIRLRAIRRSADVQACHCAQCQTWTGGGPFLAIRVDDVQIEGEEAIGTYRASASGERGFCNICGTTLYWRMQGRPIDSLAVSLIADQSPYHITEEIFVDHRPQWLPPWPEASQSTEAEEVAKLNATLEGDAS